ncbi:helix-hairpin-helix domain-containing protein [Chondrinema litorale]|uniref:helix-hairpin-helix domain-containing protein n=1 Tax=Chondrinema litorale TaxID=2994555 RepID=UPI0025434AEB|nr:helix-hairpin-helix domain-containing protein [Chondrinema litorale]UZR94890.1 helix-hairpin-helix domain-containing protein [Chondrinema litorale]
MLAQDDAQTEEFIDRLILDTDEDTDYEALLDQLYQFYQHPINLNKCDREELSSLQLLSESQLNQFFKYRNNFGKLISINELQAIPEFTPNDIRQLKPFVIITERKSNSNLFKRIKDEKNKYMFFRYQFVPETKEGFIEPEDSSKQHYFGDEAKLLYRIKISHSRDFSFGITLEKDAGERLSWSSKNKTYLADFFSWHFTLYNQGKLKALSIGDYQMQFGQGLLLSGGFQMGKGSESVQGMRRSSRGILPYTSTAEFGYFRGIAASYEFIKNTEFTTFVSRKNIDATIKSTDEGEQYASSISQTGLHRTENELARKHQIEETVTGYHFRYKLPFLELGNTTTFTKYNLPIQRETSDYNQFAFNDNKLLNTGINYSLYWNNLSFFGEAAISGHKGKGIISGVLAGFGRNMEMALVIRNYNRYFHSFYGNAISEASTAHNEKGIYWGIKLKPIKKWTVSAYYDTFKFPWLRYQADAPSGGYEYLGKIAYKPSKQLELYAQYRFENRSRNMSNEANKFDQVIPVKKGDTRFNIKYQVNKQVSIQSRIQFSDRNQEQLNSKGLVLIQDIVWDLKKVKLAARVASFDTDDYNTRQYAYEKDILYAFSIPAYYGEGIRNYIMLKWKLMKQLDCWARYAATRWYDREIVGSGTEEIQGRKRSELKFQMRYKF